jgi:hypothetical protein
VNGSLGGLIIVGRHFTLQLTVLPHAGEWRDPPLSEQFSCLVLIVVSTLVLGANTLFNSYCHRLHSVGFLGGFYPVRVVSPLSLDTSSSCQYVILTY